MPWQGDPRTTTPHWRRLRLLILERDGHRCQWPLAPDIVCGRPANEVDHIRNHASGGTDDPANLRSLCSTHHRRKTSAEGHAARPRLARPAEPHPGLKPRST